MNLPEINFVKTDKESVEKEIFALYTSVTGRKLAQADPIRLFLLVITNIVILLLNRINDTGKQNLLAYARGYNLDHIGIALGVERLQATGAVTTMKLTASMARPEGIAIPKGTRFTAGDNVFFATTEPYYLSATQTTISVKAVCTELSAKGNNYPVGVITTLVDPIPYIASVTNTTISEGGADTETDDAFRERIREAPESFSCAGAEGAYEFFTKKASALISSVKVVSPKPGDVVVYPGLVSGEIAKEEILKLVEAALTDKKVRPLTDNVSVKAPAAKNYDINLQYYIDSDNAYYADTIKNHVDEAVTDYIKWQSGKVGRDIIPSELIRRIMEAGAKRVTVTSPTFTVVKDGRKEDGYQVELAQCTGKTITYGGVEHE